MYPHIADYFKTVYVEGKVVAKNDLFERPYLIVKTPERVFSVNVDKKICDRVTDTSYVRCRLLIGVYSDTIWERQVVTVL